MQGLAAAEGCRRLAVAFLMQCLAVAGVVGGWPQLS